MADEGRSGAQRLMARGAMADLFRAKDWTSTPLGPISGWSDTLVTSVNMMLAAAVPVQLLWGPEFLCLYNDALMPAFSDKHPESLGMPGATVWSEAWHTVGPQLEDVRVLGTPLSFRDVHLPLLREGRLHDYYWTYAYSPVYGPDGSVEGVLDIAIDSTETVMAARQRDAAEAALRAEREQLLTVVQQAPAFVGVLDGPEHRFVMANERYRQLVGGREIVGRTVAEALPEAAEQGYVAMLDEVFATGKAVSLADASFTLSLDGLSAPVELCLDFTYQPLRDADGTVRSILVLGVDGTERKRTLKALLQTEKLAVAGRLSASIAHEINNPLESVTNLLYLAKQANESGAEGTAEVREYIEIAERELRRVSAISSQTLRFYRQSTNPRAVACAELFETAISVYQGRFANSSVAVERRDRALQPVECFDGEIRQVISNLMGNAIDAMSVDGGRLLLRSREATHPKTCQPGVVLTVADTGVGMSVETQRRAFEAFYTTKGIGGTGLGLWVSHEIVARHGGTLRFRSSQRAGASGTVFTVFLPLKAVKRVADAARQT